MIFYFERIPKQNFRIIYVILRDIEKFEEDLKKNIKRKQEKTSFSRILYGFKRIKFFFSDFLKK